MLDVETLTHKRLRYGEAGQAAMRREVGRASTSHHCNVVVVCYRHQEELQEVIVALRGSSKKKKKEEELRDGSW